MVNKNRPAIATQMPNPEIEIQTLAVIVGNVDITNTNKAARHKEEPPTIEELSNICLINMQKNPGNKLKLRIDNPMLSKESKGKIMMMKKQSSIFKVTIRFTTSSASSLTPQMNAPITNMSISDTSSTKSNRWNKLHKERRKYRFK